MPTRKIDTQIARDTHWKKMSIELRYFWFYLLTTDFSKAIGIFYLPLEIASFETNLSVEKINQYLQELEDMQLLLFSRDSSEVVIFNYPKYNIFGWNEYMKAQITNELSTIKNLNLITIISHFIENYIITRPNDKRTIYLSQVLKCCKKALKPYEEIKEKEKIIDKDKDKDIDKDEDEDIDKDIDTENELNKKEIIKKGQPDNWESVNWEELTRIAHTQWLKDDD